MLTAADGFLMMRFVLLILLIAAEGFWSLINAAVRC